MQLLNCNSTSPFSGIGRTKEINMSTNNNRIIQFDALRVIAAYAVVLLHTSCQRYYDCYPSAEWIARNFYDSSTRWAVPIFIMISGALFLDPQKKIDIKNLFTKNITRVLLIFIAWSIIYGAYFGDEGKGITGLIIKMVHGPYHFWFLKMLIGLYVYVPILRVIVANKKMEQYFICLLLVTAFVIPMLFPIIGHFSDYVRGLTEKYYDEFEIKNASGYIGYFVLGHYLNHTIVKGTVKNTIYFLGVTSVIAVSTFTHAISNHVGSPDVFLYDYLNLFTLFEALAFYLFIKGIKIAPKYHRFIISASKLSLGIYIIHPLIITIVFDLWKIDSALLNPIIFIPVFAVLIFGASYAVIYTLSKIPLINKIVI